MKGLLSSIFGNPELERKLSTAREAMRVAECLNRGAAKIWLDAAEEMEASGRMGEGDVDMFRASARAMVSTADALQRARELAE